MTQRRQTLLSALAWLAAPARAGGPAALRWLVPYPPGGGSDLGTRIVARRVGELCARFPIYS